MKRSLQFAAATLSVAIVSAGFAQPRNAPPNQFGDRQAGEWGNPDEGHFGNSAEGHFGWSRQPLERRIVIDPETGRPIEQDGSPYVVLDLPPDQDRIRQ